MFGRKYRRVNRKRERELREKLKILEKSLEDINELKYAVVEGMITDKVGDEELDNWTENLQKSVDPFEIMINDIKKSLEDINKADVVKTKESMAMDDSKREVKLNAKLPKLHIAKFNGTHIDWFRFWNQFQAEIDASNLPPVTKFSYLRDMLTTRSLSLVNGLPFTSEGYERSKTILQAKYGKTSEVVNAHIQRIMDLPILTSSNSTKIHEFYEMLVNSVQSLETMGKLDQIQGYVRRTLDKLPAIRSDLVRLDKDWQDWDFALFVGALGEWTERNPKHQPPRHQPPNQPKHPGEKILSIRSEVQKCVYCGADHKPSNCNKITNTNERRNILRIKRCCFNCTKDDHRATECKGRSCYKCNGRHHTSICDKVAPKSEFMGTTIGEVATYPTVIVKVNGMKCRALLDSGSGSNYISASLAKALMKKPKRTEQRKIEMLMSSTNTKVDIYDLDLHSLNTRFSTTCEVSKVQKDVLLMIPNPNYKMMQETFHHLRGINFNDEIDKDELQVHMIIGVDVYCKIKVKKEPRIKEPGQPVAELTKFGWVLMSPGEEINKQTFLTQSAQDYDNLCRIDVLGLPDRPEGDQEAVYSEFKEQLKRSPQGWYETGLMWKANHDELPNNKASSLRRMNNLLNKLKREPAKLEEYNEKIAEQLREGIVEPAPDEIQGREHYIPHKPVRREATETTKLRIVYDASSKPNDASPSLNDCLETGPLLLNRLWTILTRNRMKPIAITGDIKQAFHQIRIRKEHRDALRFHWIENTSTCETTALRFTRAVMGLVQAPFLLNGIIEYHFENYKEELREIVEEIKDDIYVDDVIGGASTMSEAKKFKESAIKILGDAKFILHKWHSSNSDDESEELGRSKHFGDTKQATKKTWEAAILGVAWNKQRDTFSVTFRQHA